MRALVFTCAAFTTACCAGCQITTSRSITLGDVDDDGDMANENTGSVTGSTGETGTTGTTGATGMTGPPAPPVLISFSPASGSMVGTLQPEVSFTFDKNVDAAIAAEFSLVRNGTAVAVTTNVFGTIVAMTPTAALTEAVTYELHRNGAVLGTFSVLLPFTIATRTPAPSATNVPVTSAVSVTFTKTPIAGATLTLAAVSGVTGVTGVTSASGATLTFTPDASLDVVTAYTASVTAESVHGQTLSTTWTFTTRGRLKAFIATASNGGNLGASPNAGGQTGAAAGDAICNARAATLGFNGQFVAWLSTSSTDAYCHLFGLAGKKASNCGAGALPTNAGPWERSDGRSFAPTIDQVVNSFITFHNAEPSTSTTTLVMTATTASGELNTGATTCGDWTLQDTSLTSGSSPTISGYLWTNATQFGCNWPLGTAIMCLETGAGPALAAPPTGTKKIFVSSASGSGILESWKSTPGLSGVSGITGLAAGDTICQLLAGNAGLANPNNFIAWLSSSTTDAKDRVTGNGPWHRPDGTLVAASKGELLVNLQAGIAQDETGAYENWHWDAWTGTTANGTKSANLCGDWNSTSGNGEWGMVGYGNRNWTQPSAFNYNCGNGFRLYCLEN